MTPFTTVNLDSEVLEQWANDAMARQVASEALRRYIA